MVAPRTVSFFKRGLVPLLLAQFFVPVGQAEVILDGSLGASGEVPGPDYQISADLGQQAGANLFHSFEIFTISTNESATFSGPASIENIINRVTGGSQSWIDGVLASEIAGANLYLLNPAGVIFGPNGSLDLSGSFHLSTADFLELGQDDIFFSTLDQTSNLSVAPVSAFGFLSEAPSAIEIQGDGSNLLQVDQGETLSLIGGDLTIRDSVLLAPGGEISLVSFAGAGQATVLDNGGLAVTGSNLGTIAVERGADTPSLQLPDNFFPGDLDVSAVQGESSGSIFIRGGDFVLTNGWIQGVTGDLDGGDIAIQVDGGLEITTEQGSANPAVIGTFTAGQGNAGEVLVQAEEVTIDAQSEDGGIYSQVYAGATGSGGAVNLNASSVSLLQGAVISTSTYGEGDAGSLEIEAQDVLIDNSTLWAHVDASASGNGGDVTISATGSLQMLNNAEISVSTFGGGDAGAFTANAGQMTIDQSALWAQVLSSASGQGGHVSLAATESFSISNGGFIGVSTYGDGDAGNLAITAPTIILSDADLRAQVGTGAAGSGGDLALNAAESIQISDGSGVAVSTFGTGDAGRLTMTTSDLLIDGQGAATGIYARVENGAAGNGGDVIIEASGSVELTDGGEVNVATFGIGNAGNLQITAEELVLNGGDLWAEVGSGASGNGGDMNITASGDIQLIDGANISVSTYGQGDAGSLAISAENLSIQGGNETAGIYARVYNGAAGNGGDVSIVADNLVHLADGGTISVSTYSEGDAGSLQLQASDILLAGGNLWAQVTDSATGSGGSVNIEASNSLQVMDGSVVSVSTLGEGDAGALSITAGQVVLDNGSLWAEVGTGASGAGGGVVIEAAESVELIAGGDINVSTYGQGDAGSLAVSTGDLLIDGQDSGIYAQVASTATGNGGDVLIDASGSATLTSNGEVNVTTFGTGDAGSLEVNAADLLLSGGSLWAQVSASATGNGGDMALTASESVEVLGGSSINVSTYGEGDAGSLSLETADLLVDGQGSFAGIYGLVQEGATGSGGGVSVNASGTVELADGGDVNVNTFGVGDAGSLEITTTDLVLNGGGLWAQVSSSATGNGGDMSISASESVEVLGGSSINVSTYGEGDAGSLSIVTQDLLIDGQDSYAGIYGRVQSGATGNGGDVLIHATGTVELTNEGEVNVNTFGEGDAGSLALTAGELILSGGNLWAEVGSGGSGNGGDVLITASDSVQVSEGSSISVSTYGEGDAGQLSIDTHDLLIDGQDSSAGIYGRVQSNAAGDGGDVTINASGTIELRNEGEINVATFSTGNAGNLDITSADLLLTGGDLWAEVGDVATGNGGDMTIAASNGIQITDGSNISVSTYGEGDAGSLVIETVDLLIEGQDSYSGILARVYEGAEGNGGDVAITASGTVQLLDSSRISVSTFGTGNAGALTVNANQFSLDGANIWAEVASGATGSGGDVILAISHAVEFINGGQISVSTYGQGDAGELSITADTINIGSPGDSWSGIYAQVQSGATGNGGDVTLTATEAFSLSGNAEISVSTFGAGNAGSLTVAAHEISIDGQEGGAFIFAQVLSGAEGAGGNILLAADQVTISGQGQVLAATYGTGSGGSITIDTDTLFLAGEAEISSASYSFSEAGTITINAADSITLNNSSITTEALLADGGNITINAANLLQLQDSDITTTVEGGSGGGGDISIDPIFVVLANSDIVANAFRGNGGNISIVADYFLAWPDSTIQATSELGIDGSVQVEALNVDINKNLVVLPSSGIVPELAEDRCTTRQEQTLSSLTVAGQGGLAQTPEHLRVADVVGR